LPLSLTVALSDSVRSAGSSYISFCDCENESGSHDQEKIRDTPFYLSVQQRMRNSSSEVVLIVKKRGYGGYRDFTAKLGASDNQYFRGTYDVSPNELIGSFERFHHDRYCPNAYCSTSQSVRVKWRAPKVTISGIIYFYIDIYPNPNSQNFLSFKKPLNITSEDLQHMKLSITQQIKNEKPDEDFEELEVDDRASEEEVKCDNKKDKNVNIPLIISTILVVVVLVGIVIFDICFWSRYKDQKMADDDGQFGDIHSKENTIDDRDSTDEGNDNHDQQLHFEKFSTLWAYLRCCLKGTQQFLVLLVNLLRWIQRFVSLM